MDLDHFNRRDFLKSLGVAGTALAFFGSLGAAEAGDYLQHKTAGGLHGRPWWVRTVEQPTTGIHWPEVKRFDAFQGHVLGHGWLRWVSPAERARLEATNQELEIRRILTNQAGYTLPDYALYTAFETLRAMLPTSFVGPQVAPTPDERGVPRWVGGPAEAAQIVKAAMRQMGAANVGIVHLDENTRKLVFAVDVDGKRITFEDVPSAYETPEKRVIPNKCEWAIVYTVQMSLEGIKRSPTVTASAASSLGYLRGLLIQPLMQEFLRGLGYQALGEVRRNALAIAPGLAVLGGLGELSRQNRLITPEHGPLVRIFKLITDLPLEADQPIDAGIVRFCKVCKKCAEACPPGALSFAAEPFWETSGGWNNPGHQAWFEDGVKCRTYWQEEAGEDCAICFSVCPFSKGDRSFMNKFIKMHIAATPGSASVIRSLDDAFGYGVQKDLAQWWELDLPEYGIDTTAGKQS